MTDLTQDTAARSDLVMRYLRGELPAQEARALEAAAQSDDELAADIAVLQAAGDTVPAAGPVDELAWQRLSREMDRDILPVGVSPRWRIAAAVAMLAFFGQSLWMAGAPEPLYETATVATSGPQIQVSFAPTLTEAELRALVTGLDAAIVGGPGSLGIYTLSLPEGADRAAALEALRTAAGVESAFAAE